MDTYTPSAERTRNTARSEYEAMPDSREGDFNFVGYTERRALDGAFALAVDRGERVRLYHTHASPGPVRRFMGTVDADGTFNDARR